MKAREDANSIVFSDVIKMIFHGAYDKGIKYCILRNYEDLPDSTQGGDIDMLILPEMKKQWCKHLESVANIYGLNIGVIQKHYHGVRYCVFDTRKPFFIKLDVHYGEFWKGVEYITSKSMLKTSKTYRDFFIPSIENEALLSLLDPILTGGRPKAKYKQGITESVILKTELFSKELANIVGKENADKVTQYIVNNKYEQLIDLATDIKQNLWLRHFYRSYGRDIFCIYEYLKYEFHRRVYPFGFLIQISGSEDIVEHFVREFSAITDKQYPGIDINCDVESGSPYEIKKFKRILQSYNIVIRNEENLNNNFKINKQIEIINNDQIYESGNVYNFVEMTCQIYDDVFSTYIFNYNKLAIKN